MVHISAGHHSGTLVNALLHHLGLPGISVEQVPSGTTQRCRQTTGVVEGPASSAQHHFPVGPASGSPLHSEPDLMHADVVSIDTEGGIDEEDEEEGTESTGLLPAPLPSSSPQPGGVLRPGIVHRLDKGTSGLLVVAKNEAAHRGLCEQFKARTVGREYSSIVVGTPVKAVGR